MAVHGSTADVTWVTAQSVSPAIVANLVVVATSIVIVVPAVVGAPTVVVVTTIIVTTVTTVSIAMVAIVGVVLVIPVPLVVGVILGWTVVWVVYVERRLLVCNVLHRWAGILGSCHL